MRRATPVTWEDLRVGAFIVIGLALLATGIFLIGQIGHVFGDRYRLVTVMPSAAGLMPGANVQLAGQNVGQVAEIEWIPTGERPKTGEAVAVWLSVDREIQRQIRADSRARVRTRGLLGDRVIDIDPGSADERILRANDSIRSSVPVDYQAIVEQAAGAVTQLTRLSRDLERLTSRMLAGQGSLGRLLVDDTLYRRLSELSGGLNRFLSQAADGEGALGRLLTDEDLYDRLVSTTAALDTLTGSVARGEGSLGRLLGSDSLYSDLLSVTDRSNRLLERLEGGEGTAGRMLADEALYEELLRTLVDLNAVVQELREDPERYIPPVRVF